MSLKEDVAVQTVLATPPSGVVTLTLMGYQLDQLILVGTGILLVLQIGYLLHKWVRMATDKEAACSSDKD